MGNEATANKFNGSTKSKRPIKGEGVVSEAFYPHPMHRVKRSLLTRPRERACFVGRQDARPVSSAGADHPQLSVVNLGERERRTGCSSQSSARCRQPGVITEQAANMDVAAIDEARWQACPPGKRAWKARRAAVQGGRRFRVGQARGFGFRD